MISVTIPIKIESESNKREHWSKVHARRKKQAGAIRLCLASQIKHVQLPVTVTITRIAPRALDGDNMQAGAKGIRDQIGMMLVPGTKPGQADSDPKITWCYAQRKASKTYAVEIKIEPREVIGYQT